MPTNVMALMDSVEDARTVVDDLIAQGIDREAISIVAIDPEGASVAEGSGHPLSDKQMAGVTRGFGAGAGVGGVAGLIAGLTTFAVPGGALIAGPIVATVVGASIGAYTGGVFGAIRNLGVKEEEAAYYAEGVQRGGILVGVQVEAADARRVEATMRDHGAVDIDRRADEWRRAGWEGPVPRRGEGAGDRPHH